MESDATALVDVIVQDDGQQPIGVYKLIQRASALAITQTQAKKMFKAGQQPVIADISKDRADALKLEFEGLGAKVELRPHAS